MGQIKNKCNLSFSKPLIRAIKYPNFLIQSHFICHGRKQGKFSRKKSSEIFPLLVWKVFLGDLTIITWHGRLRLSLCCCLAEGATLRPVWTTCDEFISKVILPWVIFNDILQKQHCSKTISLFGFRNQVFQKKRKYLKKIMEKS